MKNSPYSGIGRVNVKIAIFLRLVYRFNIILIKLPVFFFVVRNWKVDPKIHIEKIRNPEEPKIFKKGNQIGELTHFFYFKLYW